MSEQPNATESVYAAIAAVSSDLCSEGVGKNRRNAQQGYSFRGIDDIYQVLSPMLVKNGLIVVPEVEQRSETIREAKSGGAIYSVVVRTRFRMISVKDGSSVEAVVWGEAMDSADKATNKAMSAAYKYWAFMTFCIPLEGSDDADASTPETTRIEPKKKVDSAPPYDLIDEALADIASAKNLVRLDIVKARMQSSKFSDLETKTARTAYLDKRASLVDTSPDPS